MTMGSELYGVNKDKIALLKRIVVLFTKNNIRWWLCGGFAMEACLGPRSLVRQHKDLDFIVASTQINTVERLLRSAKCDITMKSEFLLRAQDADGTVIDITHYDFAHDGSAVAKMKAIIGRDITFPPVMFTPFPKKYFGATVFTIRPEKLYLDYKKSMLPKNHHKDDLHHLQTLLDPKILSILERSRLYLTQPEIRRLEEYNTAR